MNFERTSNKYFDIAHSYWSAGERPHLVEIGEENLKRVFRYSQTPEGRVSVSKRGGQLNRGIGNFNYIRQKVGFNGPYQKESAFLAKKILEPGENLPILSELPQDEPSTLLFFQGFLKLMRRGYYTFVDKKELSTLEDLNILITSLLVDGYGFAVRGKRAYEKRQGHPKSDLTIVNAICEMVPRGEMQSEMYRSNWYKPDYGLTPEFCNFIARQYGA
ncbi:MAG: hypothetical protein WAV40_02960 [Microgenomates group bacterium]